MAAPVAVFGDLGKKGLPGDLPAGLLPTLGEARLEGVELAAPGAPALHHVLPVLGVRVPADRIAAPPQVAGDLAHTHAVLQQLVDQGVVGAAAVGHPPGGVGRLLVGRAGLAVAGQRGLPLWFRLRLDQGEAVQAGAVVHHGAFDGAGEVLPQVEAVSHLQGLGRRGVGGLRVGAGAVTADHLDLRVGREPGDEGGGVALREQVQDPVALGPARRTCAGGTVRPGR